MMMGGMQFYAFWTLCGLAAVVLAAQVPASKSPLPFVALGAAGFLAGPLLFRGSVALSAAYLGVLVVCLAVIQLLRPQTWMAAALGAGLIAAQAGAMLASEGLPVMLAVLMTAVLLAVPISLSVRQPRFAPSVIREEALLIVLVLGIVVAAAPEVASGWASAVALNSGTPGRAGSSIPAWALLALGVAAALGGVSRFWRQR